MNRRRRNGSLRVVKSVTESCGSCEHGANDEKEFHYLSYPALQDLQVAEDWFCVQTDANSVSLKAGTKSTYEISGTQIA